MLTNNQISIAKLLGSAILLLGGGLEGADQLRGGFASGGLTVGDGYSVRGSFSAGPSSSSLPSVLALQSGVATMLDYSYQDPGAIVLANPNDPSAIQGLTTGEVFFFAGLATGANQQAALYQRLPRITEGASGLFLTYDRSGAASRAMTWSYEISSDLVNWTPLSSAFEDVIFDGSKNTGTVLVQLPAQSPVFVRIQLDYNEQ